jgi:hypothetical protein
LVLDVYPIWVYPTAMPPKNPDLNEKFIFKLPRQLLDDVRQVAAQSDRSVSAEIRHVLRAHVRQQQEGVAAKR